MIGAIILYLYLRYKGVYTALQFSNDILSSSEYRSGSGIVYALFNYLATLSLTGTVTYF